MSVIGIISAQTLEGHISTLQQSFRFRLFRLPKQDNPNAPAYRAIAISDSGVEVEIGSAWLKSMKRAGREGGEFLSLTFDDPSFSKPLSVAAFKSVDTGDWDITFRRRQARAA